VNLLKFKNYAINQVLKGLLWSLCLTGFSIPVASAAVSDRDLIGALQEAFMMHFQYTGKYEHKINRGYGLGCKKDRDLLVHWRSTLKDLDVSLSDNGTAVFAFNLENSKAYISYTGKTSLCMFKGYFGDVLTDNIRGEFHIIPRAGTHAAVDIKSLELSNLKFVNWTLFDPFVLDVQGDAPKFINDWTQKSINGLVKSFLSSGFSDRLDRFVSDKIEEELKKRYDGEPLRFEQAQDSDFLLL
jgi:hypothetical protein